MSKETLSPPAPNYAAWVPHLVNLAEEAGRVILDIYSTDFQVRHKSDRSPLTAADMSAHHVISDGLEDLTPELPCLSEESAHVPFAQRRQWERYWLIDPLDGTREFIKRNGEFTVNIALIEDGWPLLGIIHIPITGTTYLGGVGVEAMRMDANGRRKAIRSRKATAPYIVARSRWPADDDLAYFLKGIGPHDIVRTGSSIKSCLVAEGRADVYPRLGPTMEWDTAAAQAILEAAGAHLTDTRRRRLRYNTKESLMNPHFFAFGDGEMDWARFLPPDYGEERPS